MTSLFLIRHKKIIKSFWIQSHIGSKTIKIPNNDKISKTRWCDLGKVIIVASETGNLYKYDYETTNKLMEKKIHNNIIMDLDISPKEELP